MPCRPAIASMSLGRAWVHSLPNKLDQAQKYGFEGIEVFYGDLEYLAREQYSKSVSHAQTNGITNGDTNGITNGTTKPTTKPTTTPPPDALLKAARTIRQWCDQRKLAVIALQPFMHYEGLRDHNEHKARIEELRTWFSLAHALGTHVIQIPSSFLPASQITPDIDAIAADMLEVAELGAQESPVINFAYESLAWGTYVDTWDMCWKVVEKVDRPNFGVCLDTFHIAGRVYADPTSPNGKTPNAEADLKASLTRLVKTVDVNRIFFVQIVDAEKLDKPLVKGHPYYKEDQPARMSWSRNFRLFYGEEDRGAYLPIKDIMEAFLKGLGYDGWVSMELFSRTMADPAPETPENHARRGAESWKKLVRDLDLKI